MRLLRIRWNSAVTWLRSPVRVISPEPRWLGRSGSLSRVWPGGCGHHLLEALGAGQVLRVAARTEDLGLEPAIPSATRLLAVGPGCGVSVRTGDARMILV